MKPATFVFAVTLTLGAIHESAEAQVAQRQQGQNMAAGGNANQGQPFAAQFQTGQLAKMMLANFDRDGDGMLNPAELQPALTAWLMRIRASAGLFPVQPFAAQLQSRQLAQMMLANFDRDGDGMLNPVELQAALTLFLVRMSANSGLLQMQAGGGQAVQQPSAGFQNAGAGNLSSGQFPAGPHRGGNQPDLGFQGRRGGPAGGRQRGGRGR